MPERKFYLHAWWKWILALLLLIFLPLILLFLVGVLAIVQLHVTKGMELPGGRGTAALILLPLLGYRFIGSVYGIYYNPHVVLTKHGLRGQEVHEGGMFGGKFCFRRGFMAYGDIGAVRGGSIFGVGYTYFHSASEKKRAIVVCNSVRNVQECFDIINKKRQEI